MSNALKIDSFGSRSRRNRITASTQREGSAPSFAQRSASSASIVTRCRLSPRRSRTITSKVNPLPRTGGNSDRRLAHLLYPWRRRGLSRTIAQQLKRMPDDKLLAAQAKSYRRSSGSATPVAPVSTKISGGCALSTCPSLAAVSRRFLALTGNQLDRCAF